MFFEQLKAIEARSDDNGLPIYLQSWFTDIVAQHGIADRTIVAENGKTVGSMALYYCKNAFGMKQAYNLPWARFGGPVISSDINPIKRRKVICDLIEQLPTDVSYFLTLPNSFDYQAFLSAGFQPDLEDNYYLPVTRPAALQSGFSRMARRHIRKAGEQLLVSTASPASFIEIYAQDLANRRRKPFAPLEIAHNILAEAIRRGQARITTACRRDNGQIDAAVASLWDADNYYYWMTTRRVAVEGQTKPHQGAVKLLIWTAIQDAHARGLNFDFDGAASGRAGVAQLYKELGACKSVRFRVKRETRTERLVSQFRAPIKHVIRSTLGLIMTLKLND